MKAKVQAVYDEAGVAGWRCAEFDTYDGRRAFIDAARRVGCSWGGEYWSRPGTSSEDILAEISKIGVTVEIVPIDVHATLLRNPQSGAPRALRVARTREERDSGFARWAMENGAQRASSSAEYTHSQLAQFITAAKQVSDRFRLIVDDPLAGLDFAATPVAIRPEIIPGWERPANSGLSLFPFQRQGVEFVAGRGGRALIADEMGLGKTAQAIAFAHAAEAGRSLVVCPRVAVGVWETEILKWSNDRPPILSIQSWEDVIDDFGYGWLIATYDLLAPRVTRIDLQNVSRRWRVEIATSVDAMREAGGGIQIVESKDDEKSRKDEYYLVLSPPVPEVPLSAAWITKEIARRWDRARRRLGEESLSRKLADWRPDLLILDEAHLAKNLDSKRAAGLQGISAAAKYRIALTGTPIRNRADEAAAVLSHIDPGYREIAERAGHLSRGRWRRLQARANSGAIRDALDRLMIRRLKRDVLTQLPEKQRSWVPLHLDRSHPAVADAYVTYLEALEKAVERDDLGMLESARAWLAVAKVADGQIAAAVAEAVREKGCALLFVSHLEAMNLLEQQLVRAKIKVGRVDGSVAGRKRTAVVEAFQTGKIDLFLGTPRAAGLSITLTRADTCFFVEPEWVPADLLQAEDRAHRPGQTAAGYNIIHFFVPGETLENKLAELIQKKMALVEAMLSSSDRLDAPVQDRDEAIATAKKSLREEVFAALKAISRQAPALPGTTEVVTDRHITTPTMPAKRRPVEVGGDDAGATNRPVTIDIAKVPVALPLALSESETTDIKHQPAVAPWGYTAAGRIRQRPAGPGKPRTFTPEEAAARRRESRRRWAAKNKDQLRAKTHSWFEANRQKRADYMRDYRAKQRTEAGGSRRHPESTPLR